LTSATTALVATLLLQTVLITVGRPDFIASDPLWYANVAHRITVAPSDVFTPTDLHPFTMRIGLTLPLALLYSIFGVSSLVSMVPNLLAAVGITIITFVAAPTRRAKFLALFFTTMCVPLMRHGSILGVDLPCTALLALVLLCLSRARRTHGSAWLAGAAAAWFAAFLVKETAIWCFPAWVYVVVVELRASGPSQAARRLAPAVLVGVVLGVAYLAVSAKLWGSPLARFRGVEALTYDHSWSLTGRPVADWIARLTWKVPLVLGLMFNAALLPAIASIRVVQSGERVWLVGTGALLVFYWFGSASLAAYTPLPISERMVLPVLPGMLLLAAIGTDHLLGQIGWRRIMALLVLLVVTGPGALTVWRMIKRQRPEEAAFAMLRQEVRQGRKVVLVCGEPRCTAIAGFYFGFEPPASFMTLPAPDFANSPAPQGMSVRALVNDTRAIGAARSDPKSDATRQIDALGLPALARSKHVRLYDAGDGRQLWNALQPSH
jgi:hypothetical protein